MQNWQEYEMFKISNKMPSRIRACLAASYYTVYTGMANRLTNQICLVYKLTAKRKQSTQFFAHVQQGMDQTHHNFIKFYLMVKKRRKINLTARIFEPHDEIL